MQFSCDLADFSMKSEYLGFAEMQRAQSKLYKSAPKRNLDGSRFAENPEKSGFSIIESKPYMKFSRLRTSSNMLCRMPIKSMTYKYEITSNIANREFLLSLAC